MTHLSRILSYCGKRRIFKHSEAHLLQYDMIDAIKGAVNDEPNWLKRYMALKCLDDLKRDLIAERAENHKLKEEIQVLKELIETK